MCRMFGFSASRPAAVHRSLLEEPNALKVQSQDHPDGWGIGYYPFSAVDLGGATGGGAAAEKPSPLILRSINSAFADAEFAETATRICARMVIAHVRRASCGPVALDNTHPFHHGRWMFAHNGTVSRFADARAALEAEVAPDLRALARGDTDSERCFLLLLTQLRAYGDLAAPAELETIARAIFATVAIVRRLADRGASEPSSLTFLLSDGESLAAYRSGRSLHYSLAEPLPARERVDELMVASEVLSAERSWAEVPEDGFIGIDGARRVVQLAQPAGL